ncbi:MAG: hypothetical protein WCG26_12600, partial [Chloroflexales bacterium]
MRRTSFWPWLWLALGSAYFALPLLATLQFSLQAKKGVLSLVAYANVFSDGKFAASFAFSFQTALATIVISALLIVPTAYWVHLRLPELRPLFSFLPCLPLSSRPWFWSLAWP